MSRVHKASQHLSLFKMCHSRFVQVGWWMFLLWGLIQRFGEALAGDVDCMFQIGAYNVCYTTESVSIYMKLVWLMTQALTSRILTPGISNFVNASVRPCYRVHRLPIKHLTLSPQILHRVNGKVGSSMMPQLNHLLSEESIRDKGMVETAHEEEILI